MRRYGTFFFLFFLLLTLFHCGPTEEAKKKAGESCLHSEECAQGLECRAKKCRQKLENHPPKLVYLIHPKTAKTGQKIHLDATRCFDPEGDLLDFEWKLTTPKDSKAHIAEKNAQKTYFIPDIAGQYKIQLSISDRHHKPVVSEENVIKVKKAPNASPEIVLDAPKKVAVGSKVLLDASRSHDPDNDALSFHWTMKQKPVQSKALLSKQDGKMVEFIADVAGKYVIQLLLTDARGASSQPKEVVIEALKGWDKIPRLVELDPKEAMAESIVTLKLKGENFIKGAQVRFGYDLFQTTFLKDHLLAVWIDLHGKTPQKVEVRVINPNNRASKPLIFTIKDIPKPTLSSISPTKAITGAQLTLTVKGSNFLETSVVVFDMTNLKTHYVDAHTLTAELDLSSMLDGDYKVYVDNQAGRRSESKVFSVLSKGIPPSISILNPPSATVGTKIPFGVHGSGFQPNAILLFDGKKIPSKRINRRLIQADPLLDLTKVKEGAYHVQIVNPDGQKSNEETFFVDPVDPVPILDRIIPFTLYIDERNKIGIYGRRFRKGCQLFIGSVAIKNLAFKSDTYLEATIDLTQSSPWKAGDYQAYVLNPKGKKSNPFKVSISYREPQVTSISPDGWSNACGTEIIIRGAYFFKASVVKFGSYTFSTTSSDPKYKLSFVSSQELRFKVDKSVLVANSSKLTIYKISVVNGKYARSPEYEFRVSGVKPYQLELDSIQPSSGAADSVVPVDIDTSYLSNKEILPGAVAYLDGKPQITRCKLNYSKKYCMSLNVLLDLNGLSKGLHKVTVANPCGPQSNALQFLVLDPPNPHIGQIVPPFAKVGDKVKISIKGINFAKRHTLIWNGQKIPTFYNSSTSITTLNPIDFSQASAGTISFSIVNKNGKKASGKFSILPQNSSLTIVKVLPDLFLQGHAYTNVSLLGSGFSASGKLYFDQTILPFKLDSLSRLTIPLFDLAKLKGGVHHFQFIRGQLKSNLFSLLVRPPIPPTIKYVSKPEYQLGKSSSVLNTIYGKNFCETKNSYTRCPQNPTVLLFDAKNKDFSASYTVRYSYRDSISGKIDLSAISPGTYFVYVKLASGVKSNPATITFKPAPNPIASSVYPSSAERGQSQLAITIYGANFMQGDNIIFNNQFLNFIPGSMSARGRELKGKIDTSSIKFSGKYPLIVLRCLDPPTCSKIVKTSPVYITLKDPDCGSIDCRKLLPLNSEKCDISSSTKVCRPKCSSDADCQKIQGAPKKVLCKKGLCYPSKTP